MRAELPKARLEVRGTAGRLERAAAEARQGARVAGRIGLGVAKLVSGVVAFALFCATIAALSGTHATNPRLERDLERIRILQESMQAYDHRMQEAQLRAMVEASRWQPAPLSSYSSAVPSLDAARAVPRLDAPGAGTTSASKPARTKRAPRSPKAKTGKATSPR